MDSITAAIIPLVVVAVLLEIYCLQDIVRADRVRYFPKWLWVVICFISVPLGGIAYLVFGRDR